MDPDVLKFAQMTAIFVVMCGVLGVGTLAFGFAAKLLRRVGTQPPMPRVDDLRMERLEQAVDAIAIEVERISESQRFISRLMSERSQEASILPR